MAVYAIGDVQGCNAELQSLLQRLSFDPTADQLWFVGDLVNRGPASLETLRFVRELGDAAIAVLGNHDLHLLAVAAGTQALKRKDTLQPILDAPDAAELLDWLHHRPLVHHDAELGFTLVHAGLPPQWDIPQACACAREVETVLRGADARAFLAQMYGDEPSQWRDELDGFDRLRAIINACTRLRYCTRSGEMALDYKGAPGTQPTDLMPWYEVPERRSLGARIVFGHWSTLGFRAENEAYALDTGCVWGGLLTALRLDTDHPVPVSLPCPGALKPGVNND
ncbi:MAG: symmetrical bis(5'-nucleosyl)-tetraphosphatase [Gammaproteobacteria bacterium]